MPKDCPECGLANPDSAQRCDCGYSFNAHLGSSQRALRRSEKQKPVSKGTSAFWFVVLLLVAIVVFWGVNDPPWYVQAIGYLAGFMAFGALLELFRT